MLKLLLSAMVFVGATAAAATADPAIDALVAAYPEYLAGYEGNDLIWKDGTRMPISDGRTGKSFEQLLNESDIKDQFAFAYPLGTTVKKPAVNEDPGRIRYQPFFVKMYGDCRKGEVAKRLKRIAWMPHRRGGSLRVTTVNAVNEKLAAVVQELEKLPASMTKYLVPSAGTYNCRTIVNTKRLSVHAYGAAIDINTKFADYWEWSKRRDGTVIWRNHIPAVIAAAFERHGFIWGAKWYHFDTMHFEYRPELIALAKQNAPQQSRQPGH
jgi:D-alanyl-D-alanine carboxypeptidase/Extensin-like protein C-terminus